MDCEILEIVSTVGLLLIEQHCTGRLEVSVNLQL